jgi:glycosyltransferase involved in cell wall biosynthesis
MNILILTHSYPDVNHKWRGIFIQEQARALSTEHNVTVVYFKVDYSDFSPFSAYSFINKADGQLTIYEVTISKSFPLITQFKYLSNTYRFLNKEIFQKVRPELIHSHLSYPAGFLGAIVQKGKGIPSILTEHSTIKMYFRSFLHKRSVIYALRKSKGVVSVSHALKKEIIQYCNRHVSVVFNIVDTDNFELTQSKRSNVVNIGFLGGLNNTNKGLDLLLKAASLLKGIKFVLHLGGDGILLDSYKKLARELGIESSCIFHGEILRSNIRAFYSGLDIFVLPSRYETFGIVLIEAMASGVPVISTRCGGPQDIVIPSTGMLIEKDNVKELADAITTMVKNIGSYNKEEIRNYARETFGRTVFIKRITKAYKDILTSYSNG